MSEFHHRVGSLCIGPTTLRALGALPAIGKMGRTYDDEITAFASFGIASRALTTVGAVLARAGGAA